MRLALALAAGLSLQAVTISTAQYDISRNGVNNAETSLTPANVASIGVVGSYSLDAVSYGQPLYIPSIGGKNLVISATTANTVYALDADSAGGAPIWSTNLGAPGAACVGDSRFYGYPIGILSTPVVDTVGGFIYVVTCTTVSAAMTYTLQQLNLTTGAAVNSVVISGSVAGTGAGSSAGTLPFNPAVHCQRTALTLANGKIYVAFASLLIESIQTWHGWVFAFDASTLAKTATWCTTPNGYGGGVWMSAGGLAVDGSGNLYLSTGNGIYDGAALNDYSQSIVKLSPSLAILDWFTPSNQAALTAVDADISSGRVMLIPGTSWLTFASKDGRGWVLDSTTGNMGHLQGSGVLPQQILTVQTVTAGDSTGVYGGNFFQLAGTFPSAGFSTGVFSFSTGTNLYNTTGTETGSAFNQVMLAGSSNAGASSLLWAITVAKGSYSTQGPATLRALDPSTMATLWSSAPFLYSKFADPTVANGRVYVATGNSSVLVFGPVPFVTPVSVTGRLVAAP